LVWDARKGLCCARQGDANHRQRCADVAHPFDQHRAQEDGGEFKNIRRGWCLGGETFRQELLAQTHARAGENHQAQTRRESAEEKARRILQEELDKLGWTVKDLAARSKGDVRKVRLAGRLRTETSVTWKWISEQLHMGTWAHGTSLKIKTEPAEQNEFKLE
jgi:hypothetical protein